MIEPTVIGIDIGGTKLAGIRFEGGRAGRPEVRQTPKGARETLDAVVDLIREVSGSLPFSGVGVGSAGVFDSSGVVTSATDLLPGWTGTDVAGVIGKAFGTKVVAINDVHAAGLAEATFGAGRGVDRLLVVTVGTGLGGALVSNGRVELGRTGTAGSIGHTWLRGSSRRCSCGLFGHAEPAVSGVGMEAAFIAAGGPPLGLRDIATLARDGDVTARAVIEAGARALGATLASAAHMADPDLVIVGGGVASLGEAYLDDVRRGFTETALAPIRSLRIVAAALGTTATCVGAAVAIAEHLRLSRHRTE